jgi:hypothetical protein
MESTICYHELDTDASDQRSWRYPDDGKYLRLPSQILLVDTPYLSNTMLTGAGLPTLVIL